MTEPRAPFICAYCGTHTAILHCPAESCDWLVCLVCESVINDQARCMPTRERYVREIFKNPAQGA